MFNATEILLIKINIFVHHFLFYFALKNSSNLGSSIFLNQQKMRKNRPSGKFVSKLRCCSTVIKITKQKLTLTIEN